MLGRVGRQCPPATLVGCWKAYVPQCIHGQVNWFLSMSNRSRYLDHKQKARFERLQPALRSRSCEVLDSVVHLTAMFFDLTVYAGKKRLLFLAFENACIIGSNGRTTSDTTFVQCQIVKIGMRATDKP